MARRRARLALPLACLLLLSSLTGLPSGAQVAAPEPGPLLVPAGTVLAVAGNVTASRIEVAGTLLRSAPGDLVLAAKEIRLLNGSMVLGWDATQPDLALGTQAIGAPGARGGGVTLHAPGVVVEVHARVVAGSGSAGAPAIGWEGARGGDGGAGGSIRIEGPADALHGLLLPGAGGDGAPAFVAATGEGEARGGDGGASGSVLANGKPLHRTLPAIAAPAATKAATVDLAALCHAVARAVAGASATPCPGSNLRTLLALFQETLDRCAGRDASVTSCASLLAAPQTNYPLVDNLREQVRTCTFPGTSLLPVNCGDLLTRLLGLPDTLTPTLASLVAACIQSPPTAPCRTQLPLVGGAAGFALEQLAAELAACGIGSSPDAPALAVAGKECRGLLDAAAGTVTGLPAFLASGAPGATGGTTVGCGQPSGEDGAVNAMGDGGRGGDACVEVRGDEGSAGAKGSSGVLNCRGGGPGGNGGGAGAAGAVAGGGGIGSRNGGAGGHASATSRAGNGGAGGSGGTRWLGANCPGGPGGAGGSSGDATATGGNGGAGLCGLGGAAGLAAASSRPGSGGGGGPGTPAGPAGVPGVAGASTPKGGEAGAGPGVCSHHDLSFK